MNIFKRRQIAKRLQAVGSQVDESYMLYVNNVEPITFSTYQDCIDYLQHFRESSEIFKLQIYRIETYSL